MQVIRQMWPARVSSTVTRMTVPHMTTPEPEFQSRAVRALVFMHEDALRGFLPLWREARALNVLLPVTDDPYDRSLEHLLQHVLHSAGQYLTRVSAHLHRPAPLLPALPDTAQVAQEAEAYVEHLLWVWRETLRDVQDADMEPEIYTPGMHYWLDAMLEHAAFHPLRHAFQLRELIAAQTPPPVLPHPHLPTEFRTPRLLLRAPRPEDAQSQVDAIQASFPELRQWMHWAQAPQTLQEAQENLTAAAEAYATRENLRLLIWNADGTELIGSSGYHSLDWEVPRGEIGYWIATPHTGQGYAQEVAAFLTEYGLNELGFKRLEIRCDSRNERSARIPKQLGYTLDAVFKNDMVAADDRTRVRDTLVFSKTADDG